MKKRKGAILVWGIFLVFVAVVFTIFAVDVSRLFFFKAYSQTLAEVSALSIANKCTINVGGAHPTPYIIEKPQETVTYGINSDLDYATNPKLWRKIQKLQPFFKGFRWQIVNIKVDNSYRVNNIPYPTLQATIQSTYTPLFHYIINHPITWTTTATVRMSYKVLNQGKEQKPLTFKEGI